MGDYSWLGDIAKYVGGAAGTASANEATQAAYRQIIQNMRDRFGEYDTLAKPGYKNLTAQHLGPSALGGIAPDAQARVDEQAAIAQLDDIAKSGGLNLADMAALNKLERTLSRNAGARNASIAEQYAARGQLGSGQQLQMELANAQHATEDANERGESIAAQAQQRAMDAVLKKGSASHAISKEDYERQRSAAEAQDAIARYNASMETDASKYNNNLAGQSYDDELRRIAGKNQVTGQLNDALLGSGKQQANTNAAMAYGGVGLFDSLGKGNSRIGSGGDNGNTGGGGPGGGDERGDSSSAQTNDDPWGSLQSDDMGGGGDEVGDTSSAQTHDFPPEDDE